MMNTEIETPRKIHVVHVVESFGAGVFSVIQQISNGLPSEKFDITIIHSLRSETPENYKEQFNEHVNFIYLPMTRKINLIDDYVNSYKMFKTLKKINADVLHLHSSKAGFLGRLVGKLLGIKTMYYSPHGFSFLQQNVNPLKRKMFFLFEKIGGFFGGTILCVSLSEEEEAKKISHKTMCINNFVDSKFIKEIAAEQNEEKLKKSQFVVGTLGRIAWQKNPHLFEEVAKKFSNIKFLWIGDGDLKNVLTQKNIEVTGYVSREEALRRLSQIDIYIQLSLWEGMPMAILEAMALRKPIIASNVVGNKDLVKEGVNGYLFENEVQLEEKLKFLIENKQMRNELGNKGGVFIDKEYSSEVIIKKYIDLYSEKY